MALDVDGVGQGVIGHAILQRPLNSNIPGMNAQITSVEAILVDLPTIRAHQLAMATMQQQTLVIVRLRSSDGIEGIGGSIHWLAEHEGRVFTA